MYHTCLHIEPWFPFQSVTFDIVNTEIRGFTLGAPITFEHYMQWPMTIGEWNLHAKPLPVHTGI